MTLLFGLMAMALSGCAANRPPIQGGLMAEAQPGDSRHDLETPLDPQSHAAGDASLGPGTPAPDPVPPGQSEPVLELYSRDLTQLRVEVAAHCVSARVNGEKDFLASLVTDLYLSGVDPADATEALVLGDCGPLATVVHELVAQGGNQAAVPVVERALLLSGPDAKPVIESAASSGLEVNVAALTAQPSGPPEAESQSYAMAYFPSRGESRGLETADAVNTLYSNARPGYGVYTFVLSGAGLDAQSEAEKGRYAELLRVIETYVLAEEGIRDPSPEVHAFLVAVHPGQEDAALADQIGPELSDPLRREFARYLRDEGQAALAQRLETRPGPFLVSSVEPRLLPTSAASPRLVADLSGVGNEYLYAVVDAYDRPIPADLSGSPESLDPIRRRLVGLFARRVPDAAQNAAKDTSGRDSWVFWLGRKTRPSSAVNVPEAAAKVSARGGSGGAAAHGNPRAAKTANGP